MASKSLPPAEKRSEENEDTLTFVASECPVEKVTVYPDRAEVCRRVEAKLCKGLNNLTVIKLPDMVDSDSIRVEGKGAATITEVVFQSEAVPQGEGDISSQEKELIDKYDELDAQRRVLESELSVLKKRWELLDGFATSASKGNTEKAEGGVTMVGARELDNKFFKGLADFLDLYTEQGNSLEQKRLKLEKQLLDIEMKMQANLENKSKLLDQKQSKHEVKKCVILVESHSEDNTVSLLVSYVTSSASWKPSYDIRMFTPEGQLKITYYGQIRQSTGEDWVDAKLFLSTAMPSIGGTVPELMTAELHLRRNRVQPKLKPYGILTDQHLALSLKSCSLDCGFEDTMSSQRHSAPPPVTHADTKVGEGVATTMYEIARPTTIPSDNVEHKVTVGLIDVKPKISYTSIPQRVPHAFMLAKVTNSSPYTFLSGGTSIFLDNTFVGKADMNDVYPMEEFDCSLGVDPAVKVTYKPRKLFNASSGLLGKVESDTHEQVIVVKNTHDYSITVTVIDQLPRSRSERVKVNLLEPQIDLKHPEKSKDKWVTLNSSNNLEWTFDLKPQETREVTLRYMVEYPCKFTVYTYEQR